MKFHSFSEFESKEISHQYKSGLGCRSIGKLHHVSGTCIRRVIKDLGLIPHHTGGVRKYDFDESSFSTLSPDASYWLGFLLADGNICNERLQVGIQARDRDHLYKLRGFLRSSHPVSYKKSTNSYHFSIRSENLAASLYEHGITPRKSFTAKAPDHLVGDRNFWRGVIDGDGSVGVASRSRGMKVYSMPIIQLCGSEYICSQFLDFCKNISPNCRSRVHKSKSIYAVSIAGRFATPILRKLYADCSVYLDRKYEKANSLLYQYGG